MNTTNKSDKLKWARTYTRFSAAVTHAAGSAQASFIAFFIIIIWACTGPLFSFSNTWQLVINTGTTIVTFLMVFLIQQSQNKDTTAIQLKLNELIAANEKASNRLIDIEDLTDQELMVIKQFYIKLSQLSEKEKSIFTTHSLDEAHDVHEEKLKNIEQKKKPRHPKM